ncbi:MAG: ABC transporter permease, partial [Terriglobales bacterium]
VLFGLAPARAAGRARLELGSRGGGGRRAGNALVVAEVALALLLVIAAGLSLRSFARLIQVNPGFQPQQVLTFGTHLSGANYRTSAARAALDQRVLDRLAALPGVAAAALGTNLPLTGNHSRSDVAIANRPVPARGHLPHPDFHAVSPGYLAALGLPLLRGRNFTAADNATAPEVAWVSASFARQYWPDTDAVGQQFWKGRPGPDNHDLTTVVGVVGDTKQYGLDAATRLEIYLPFQQSASSNPQFLLRTKLRPLDLAAAAAGALHASDPTLPATDMQTMAAVVAASVANARAILWLLGVFGGLALTLALIGIYGVVANATQQRTREIGIRMALGAAPAAIARMVLGETVGWVGLGSGLGLAAALGTGRLLASQLYGG